MPPTNIEGSSTGTNPAIPTMNPFTTPQGYPTYPQYMTPSHPTSTPSHWRYQELALDYYAPLPMTSAPIPSLAFDKTPFPSPLLPATNVLSHLESLETGQTVTTAPMSLTQSQSKDEEDRGEMNPPTLSSAKPFRTAHRLTLLTPEGSTTSGTSSSRSTETYLDHTESRPGNSGVPTSRPEPAGITQMEGRTWSTSWPRTGELPSTSELPPVERLWPGSMPIVTEAYTPHTQGYRGQIYDPEPTTSSTSYSTSFYDLLDFKGTTPTWTVPPTNPFEGFWYNPRTFGIGFQPSQNAEDFFHP